MVQDQLEGVDSLMQTWSCCCSQVSESISIWLPNKSFTNRDLERRDLIFRKPHCLGADTVIMGFWGGSSRWEAAEKCVRLQLCILVSTLGCHIFGHISRYANCPLQSEMDAISPNQTSFLPERLPTIYVAHIVCWPPPRQPAVKWRHATKYIITSQIWQGPEKTIKE